MFFTKAIFPAVFAATLVSAHSWLECVKVSHVNRDQSIVNNIYAPMDITCDGYPRNKVNNGNWIAESTNYLWDLNAHGKANAPACNPAQSLNYPAGVPMATARAGETLKMRHWGNGHSEWANSKPHPRDPGLVRVYWAGEKEHEIKSASQLTNNFKIAEANFTADALIVDDPNVATGRNERANFFNVKLPDNMENGRHMMVWAWAYFKNEFTGEWTNTYTTCFDIEITGGSTSKPPVRQPIEASVAAGPADTVRVAPAISEKCQQTCFKGGVKDWPCTGAACPSCRYSSGGSINCFDKLADGSCPFVNGYDCSTGTSS